MCLFRIMVRGSVRIDWKRGSSEVCLLPGRCGVVPEQWKENGYSPAAGTIIFFDWNGDGVSDHVGIVEKCENGRVYTVEGNSNDRVQQSIYIVGSDLILGYGLLTAGNK